MQADSPQQPIPSPCNGTCRLDARGYCRGCRRSGDEIARWTNMSELERRHLIEHVLRRRDALEHPA